MKSKAPLTLMEQVMMVLVFALAAALCIQVFVFSDQTSRRNAARDRAALEAQNAAELLKAYGGSVADALPKAAGQLGGEVSQGLWYILYDEDWNVVSEDEDAVYRLDVQGKPSPVEAMEQVGVWVSTIEDISAGGTNDGPLFELTVAWQVEVSHE